MGEISTTPARGHALRKGRRSIDGQLYLVTIVTRDRAPIFEHLFAARWAVRCLYDDDVTGQGRTLAHVIMPYHVHWMLQLAGDLSSVVRLYKAKVSAGLSRRVWQRGFHDRAIRRGEDVVSASRYMVANPLRAGLVTQIGDYPHWDAVWLTG